MNFPLNSNPKDWVVKKIAINISNLGIIEQSNHHLLL